MWPYYFIDRGKLESYLRLNNKNYDKYYREGLKILNIKKNTRLFQEETNKIRRKYPQFINKLMVLIETKRNRQKKLRKKTQLLLLMNFLVVFPLNLFLPSFKLAIILILFGSFVFYPIVENYENMALKIVNLLDKNNIELSNLDELHVHELYIFLKQIQLKKYKYTYCSKGWLLLLLVLAPVLFMYFLAN